MFLTHEKHHKTQFLANFRIFRNSWLFSEMFGYFLTHRYQIWLFWPKIQILQMILEYADILNKSEDFFLDFFTFFWKVLDDSQWQVRLRGSNINSNAGQKPAEGWFLSKWVYKFCPSQKLVHLSGYSPLKSHMGVVNFPKIRAKSYSL